MRTSYAATPETKTRYWPRGSQSPLKLLTMSLRRYTERAMTETPIISGRRRDGWLRILKLNQWPTVPNAPPATQYPRSAPTQTRPIAAVHKAANVSKRSRKESSIREEKNELSPERTQRETTAIMSLYRLRFCRRPR